MCIQQRPVDRRRCDPQARPSTSFVDNVVNVPWRIFLGPESGKVPEGSTGTFIFGGTRILVKHSVGIG